MTGNQDFLPRIDRHSIPNVESFRADLARVRERATEILRQVPNPRDWRNLIGVSRQLLGLCALFPDEIHETTNTLRLGAAYAEAAVLNQLRFRANAKGCVRLLNAGSYRKCPVGDAQLTATDWINAFCFAAASKSERALHLITQPEAIEACDFNTNRTDEFWPHLSRAFTAALDSCRADLSGRIQLVVQAEQSLARAAITDELYVHLLLKPLPAILCSIVQRDEIEHNRAMAAALEAHKHYYSSESRTCDRDGFVALPLLGLSTLAQQAGLTPAFESDYLPNLSTALAPDSLDSGARRVDFVYPLQRIDSPHDAHRFFDLEGFPSAPRNHQILEHQGRLLARYRVTQARLIPEATADFSYEIGPQAMDAGRYLVLAERLASEPIRPTDSDAEKATKLDNLAAAIECVETVIESIPANLPAVEPGMRLSPESEVIYHADRGRFRRDRLIAYRDGLKSVLDQHFCAAKPVAAEAEPLRSDAHADGPEIIQLAQARQQSLESIDAIRQVLQPLFEQWVANADAETTETFRPRPGDIEKVFCPDAVPLARKAYDQIWSCRVRLELPAEGYGGIDIYVSPAGMLQTENELSRPFPGGYRGIAHLLIPSRTWVAWKLKNRKGNSAISYDGLVWCDDHWTWFPKPYRALRNSAPT